MAANVSAKMGSMSAVISQQNQRPGLQKPQLSPHQRQGSLSPSRRFQPKAAQLLALAVPLVRGGGEHQLEQLSQLLRCDFE